MSLRSYDEDFRCAHLHSWPNAAIGFSRDVFNRNKAEIMAAAKKHGYSLLGSQPGDLEAARVWRGAVTFMRVI